MSETQEQKYDSCEPMTSGQFKQLGALLFSLVPTDMTKGFAEELVDGKLHKRVKAVIEEERRDWRLLHSGLQSRFAVTIPQTERGNIIGFKGGDYDVTIETPRSVADVFAIWPTVYEDRPSKTAHGFEVTKQIERERFIEALGDTSVVRKMFTNVQMFDSRAFTPRQIVTFLQTFVLGARAWDRMERRYHFLVGVTAKGDPLMVELVRTDTTVWKFLEWPFESGLNSIDEGDIIVLGKSPLHQI